MTRLLIGFLLGIGIASALAQNMPSGTLAMTGERPDGRVGFIKTDKEGHAICVLPWDTMDAEGVVHPGVRDKPRL